MRSIEAFEHRVIPVKLQRERHSAAGNAPIRFKAVIGRGLLGIGVLVGLCALWMWLGSGGGLGENGLLAGSPDQLSYVEVTVSSGDTLWSLARRYGPEKRDIRETIDRIRAINGLDDRAGLRPGERLTIPTR